MATEVFNNIGESEIYSENPKFFKRHREVDDGFEAPHKIESVSKPITDAKKEFFEQLNDDSLTVDTCSKLTHDWGKE